MKKNQKNTGKKVENYEYHKSKEVIDPFHQIIWERKNSQVLPSYTLGIRGKPNMY